MSMQARALVLTSCLAVSFGLFPFGVRADVITTPTASIPLTPTNWDLASGISGNPLSIQQFDTHNGDRTLESVTLTMHTKLTVDFTLTFATPSTETVSVATGNPKVPGPVITLFQPDGVTPLYQVQSPDDPTFLTKQLVGPGSHTIHFGPTAVDRTYTMTLTSPADLAMFSGTGTVKLPASASAISAFTCSSGNGSGIIKTNIGLDLTAAYHFKSAAPQILPPPKGVPEPTTVALWGLGGLGLWVGRRSRTRRDRT